MRGAAARGGDREDRELRDLGLLRAGHRVRAGLGRLRRVHAGLLGEGPGTPGEGGIPEGLSFATKPELAIAQVRRLVAGGLRVLWAAADEVYGRSGEFRAALRGLGLSYVVIEGYSRHPVEVQLPTTAEMVVCKELSSGRQYESVCS